MIAMNQFKTRPVTAAVVSVFALGLFASAQSAQAAAMMDVSEIGSYSQIYQLNIPDNADYAFANPAYSVDNSGTSIPGGIGRIGYYMELQLQSGPRQWVWASMNAFTQNLAQTGVPVIGTGAVWQQTVGSMNVESNASGIVTGTGIGTGNIEFWHQCYTETNAIGISGASNTSYDFGDNIQFDRPSCYGSMQVHNFAASQTLFAWNAWDHGLVDDLGIGNNTGNGNPDWTFMFNASAYTLKNLEVWVQPNQAVPEPASLTLLGIGLAGLGFGRRKKA